MNTARKATREKLRPLHQPPKRFAPHAFALAFFGAVVCAAVLAAEHELWPVVGILWLTIAWLDHAMLSRLHESAHRMLAKSTLLNEGVGILIGTLSLTPLSVYRYVHAQHHAHLGREKDPEFWPYNLPTAPRWKRLVYAWSELFIGFALTPFLYSVRTARAWSTLSRVVRQRLIFEWAFLAGSWLSVILLATNAGRLDWLLIGYLVPAWIAGSMQTVRKFTEHLGRFGDTILTMTRTVVYRGRCGSAASKSQLHVDHHGTHHRWAAIPYYNLPEATEIVYGDEDGASTFPNHFVAVLDMLPHLLNPRVGPQWKRSSS